MKKVVIIGAGFAGLNVCKHLKNAPVHITLIDKTNHHLFQPLLYQVATAVLPPESIARCTRAITKKQSNASILMGEVVEIDKEKKTVTLENQETLSFDTLVLAPGGRHSYFGNDKWEQYAPGLKTLEDALTIRQKILLSFEKAEKTNDQELINSYLTFVIVGGGPTGVEMAGAIAEVANTALIQNFSHIDPKKTKIILIEGLERILPPYPPSLSKRAKKDLEKLGVTVMTKHSVKKIDDSGVTVEDKHIPTKNVIWAAGNQASPLLKKLNVELDKAGRAIVNNDLSIPEHPNIFVLGDAAFLLDKKGKPLPGIAPVAIQQGYYLAKQIKHDLSGKNRKPFSYLDKGNMATIGKNKAVAFTGKIKMTGLLAYFSWLFVHIIYLIGFRNRISVLIDWTLHYFSGIRPSRLIFGPIKNKK